MKKPTSNEALDPKLEELIAIKKLLVFALIRNGTRQDQIAAVLNTSQGSISRMFGKGAFDEPKSRR